jgi:LacI family transcriptional regulator
MSKDKKLTGIGPDSAKIAINPERTVTIKDLARETNLSIATVSRVINKIGRHYNEETEIKVNKAVKRLNYTPNRIAWGLKKQKTHSLGFIVPELDSYYSEIFLGAQDIAMQYGYTNFLCNTNYNIKLERLYIENLLARRVDGVVIATGLIDPGQIPRLSRAGIRIALTESAADISDVVKVLLENYKYSKMAVQHLIDNGYRRIGYISAPPEEMENLQDRFRGYKDAIRENGMELDESIIYFSKIIRGAWDLTSSAELIKTIMTKKNRPDALFIISDTIAMVAMQVIKNLGLNIPGDVGVVGFDDRRFCKYLDPSLTSIYQPKYEIGSKITELLIKNLGNEEIEKKTILLDMQLSIRQSSSGKTQF